LVADDNAEDGLSVREQEVLSLLAEGKSAQDTGQLLGIAAATVMFHYRKVADRYGTLNRTHTIVEALRRGHLPFDQVRTAAELAPKEDDVPFLP